MAELALVSGVAGLLSLVIQVAEISHRYLSSVKNSSQAIKGYFRELEILQLVLSKFEELAKDPKTAVHISAASSTIVDGCREELEIMRSKLQKRNRDSGLSKSLNRLTWPFAEAETQRVVDVLHRYQTSFHATLSADNFKLSVGTSTALVGLEKRHAQEELRTLIAWLSLATPTSNHVTAREKHEHTTGRWFLNSPDFKTWCKAETSCMWIHGIPGAGKTILCSSIIDFLLQHKRGGDAVVFFYFDYSDDEKQTLEAALRSFLCQLLSTADMVPSQFRSMLENTTESYDKRTLSIFELKKLFNDCCKEFGKVQVIVDALDESYEKMPLLDFLEEVVRQPHSNVQWIATSRLERDIEKSLVNLASCPVSLDNDFVTGDIKRYVHSRLEQERTLRTRPTMVKARIEYVLTEKAHGMFRWVECQLNALKGCLTVASVESALSDLPADLDETYSRTLKAIDRQYWEHARAAFQILAACNRPLKVEELAEAIVVVPHCKAFDTDDRLFDPKQIITICGGLIVRIADTNEVVFAHYSVQEYMLSTRILYGDVAFFALSKGGAGQRLGDICLTYLLSFDEPESIYEGIREHFPFLDYALHHWHIHVQIYEEDHLVRLPSLCASFLDVRRNHAFFNWLSLLSSKALFRLGWVLGDDPEEPINGMMVLGRNDIAQALLPQWRARHSHGRSCDNVLRLAIQTADLETLSAAFDAGCNINSIHSARSTPSVIAARTGNVDIVRAVLRAGAVINVDVQDSGKSTHLPATQHTSACPALEVGIAYKHVAVVRALLESGADPNARGTRGESMLAVVLRSRSSSSSDRLNMIELLLQYGADINGRGAHGTVLHHALIFGLSGLARYLLANGADVSVVAGDFGTTLQAAAYRSDPEIVSQLIDSGLDVNERGGWFGTALQAATHECRIEMIRLLISNGADVNLAVPIGQTPSSFITRELSIRSDRQQVPADVHPQASSLSLACYFGDLESVKLLLEAGAQVKIGQEAYSSPLQWLIVRKDWSSTRREIARLLIGAGARLLVSAGQNIPEGGARTTSATFLVEDSDQWHRPLHVDMEEGLKILIDALLDARKGS